MARRFIQTDVELVHIILNHCGPSAFLVYSVLLTHMNGQTRTCHPSLPTICEEAKVCRAKAWEAIRQLAEIGAISFTSGGGRGNATEYTIHNQQEVIQTVQQMNGSPRETIHYINGSPDKPFTETVHHTNGLSAETVHENAINGSRNGPKTVHHMNPNYMYGLEEELDSPLPPTGVTMAELSANQMGGREESSGEPSEFTRFCTAYPVVENREAALREFKRLKPDYALLCKMAEGIRRWKSTNLEAKFWPDAAKWLHDKRWNDTPRCRSDDTLSANSTEPVKREYFRAPDSYRARYNET